MLGNRHVVVEKKCEVLEIQKDSLQDKLDTIILK